MDDQGRVGLVDAASADYLRSVGYTDATPEARDLIKTRRELQEKYGTGGQQFLTGLENAGSTATFGLSTGAERLFGVDPEDIRARELANPKSALAGKAVGLAAPLLVPGAGEAEALSVLRELNAPVQISRLGARASKAVEAALPDVLGESARKVAAGAIGSSLEGAAYGLGQTVHEGMIDPKLAAEHAVANVGLGALLGGGVGATGKLLGALAKSAAPRAVPWLRELQTSQYGKTLGDSADPAVVRQLIDHDLVGPYTSPAKLLAKSTERLNQAWESGAYEAGDPTDALAPARAEALAAARVAEHGVRLARAALARSGEAAEHGPKSVLLELLGGLHGGLHGAASAWGIKRGLKMLLPKDLPPIDVARQTAAAGAGKLADFFPDFNPGGSGAAATLLPSQENLQ